MTGLEILNYYLLCDSTKWGRTRLSKTVSLACNDFALSRFAPLNWRADWNASERGRSWRRSIRFTENLSAFQRLCLPFHHLICFLALIVGANEARKPFRMGNSLRTSVSLRCFNQSENSALGSGRWRLNSTTFGSFPYFTIQQNTVLWTEYGENTKPQIQERKKWSSLSERRGSLFFFFQVSKGARFSFAMMVSSKRSIIVKNSGKKKLKTYTFSTAESRALT